MHTSLIDIRLASHQLSGSTRQTPQELLAWMGAMQAQDYGMSKWGMGIRLPGYTDSAIEAAADRGEVLRTHVLRPTWHWVAPENIRWMLSLSAGRIKAASLSHDRLLTITETLYSKTNDMIATALAGHHSLTREALGQVLQQRGVAVDRARLVHFLMRAEVEGIVCSGPRQGKAHTFALLDERVPMTAPLLREEALCRLAYIYFSSHCPATVQDFAWWSGLSLTEARQGLEGVKGDFFAEDIGGRTYWIANALATVAKAKASALLLPAFDEYIISYRDRTDVLTPEHQRLAVTSNGIFRPTLVENGLVTGLWHKQAKHTPSFDYFDAPADPVLLREAVAAYKAFC